MFVEANNKAAEPNDEEDRQEDCYKNCVSILSHLCKHHNPISPQSVRSDFWEIET